MRMTRKKLIAGAAAVAVALGISGAAYAFWTTSGAGTTTATVALSNGSLVINATVAPGIYPGGTADVAFTADNSNATDLQIGTLHLVSVQADGAHSGCDTSDFTMADVVESQTILNNTAGTALAHDGTLVYANTGVSQDACKGATLTLTLSA